jgi:hypothetical protein
LAFRNVLHNTGVWRGSVASPRIGRLIPAKHGGLSLSALLVRHVHKAVLRGARSANRDLRQLHMRSASMNPKILAPLTVGFLLANFSGTASADVLFPPTGFGPEVFSLNGNTIYQPVADANALSSPKVYVIFVGPNFQNSDGTPTAAVNQMVTAAKEIVQSSYLSRLSQYGSNGVATWGDFRVDPSLDPVGWSHTYPNPNGGAPITTTNPVWFEIDRTLSDPTYSSWAPPAGNSVLTSPIYVVARYVNKSFGVGGSYGGSNDHGPLAPYESKAINGIDVTLTSADQVDEFTWVLSHELAERISTGTSSLYETSPNPGDQIGDGEPELGRFYAWSLSSGPVVTSYWSVLDQAFVLPDGNPQRVLMTPIWAGANFTGNYVSMRTGNLYAVSTPRTETLIDGHARSYVVATLNGTASIFELTAGSTSPQGVVRYTASGTGRTPITGTNTSVTQLASTGSAVYMVAYVAGFGTVVWQYTGSGSNWTPITTSSNTNVQAIATAGGHVYMLASRNGAPAQVWQYSGSGTNWQAITGSNTYTTTIAAVNGNLYMLGELQTDPEKHVWQYSGSGTNWTQITGSAKTVESIWTAGDELMMLGNQTGSPTQVWQYSLSPDLWLPLTGTNTAIEDVVVQDGVEVFIQASVNGGQNTVYEYSGAPGVWTALTGSNTNVEAIAIDGSDRLSMGATNVGGSFQEWAYTGTPFDWTPEGP